MIVTTARTQLPIKYLLQLHTEELHRLDFFYRAFLTLKINKFVCSVTSWS